MEGAWAEGYCYRRTIQYCSAASNLRALGNVNGPIYAFVRSSAPQSCQYYYKCDMIWPGSAAGEVCSQLPSRSGPAPLSRPRLCLPQLELREILASAMQYGITPYYCPLQPSDSRKTSCCSTNARMQTPSPTTTPPTARTLPLCLVLAHNAHMRGQPTCRVSGPRRALHDGSFRTSRSGQPSVIGHQDMRQAVSLGPETLETPVE